ncbi:MAG: sugar phosphate isomerase/epimerase [Planctomycetes bacterium]|nr:sugar phosphate isomerase/epimerase [Planctomycetota bacterium]
MHRREFLKRAGVVLASSTVLSAKMRPVAAAPDKKSKVKRIGCTTVCFRARFPKTRPKDYSGSEPYLNLLDVPDLFAEKLGVHNVELWSRHFEDTSLKYCRKVKAAAKKAGSRIINIQMDEPGYQLSSKDAAQRKSSIEVVKQWMDRAAACGATSLRANTGGSAKETLDVSITGDSFRQLAEHGEKIGVKILIENHGGLSSRPENIVAVIEAVDSPWCRALPDFGNMPTNFTQQQRDGFLKKLLPHAHLISAKGMYFNKQGKHLTYDIGACVRTAEASGFKGIYSAEQWSPKPNPIDAVAAARAIIRQIADNI